MTWVHNASPEVDAKSQWPTIVAVCIALTFVMTVTVGLRDYTRAIMLKTLWADDWVILFSAVSIVLVGWVQVAHKGEKLTYASIDLQHCI